MNIFLEAQVLNVEEFLKTCTKVWKILLSDIMEGWRLEGWGNGETVLFLERSKNIYIFLEHLKNHFLEYVH